MIYISLLINCPFKTDNPEVLEKYSSEIRQQNIIEIGSRIHFKLKKLNGLKKKGIVKKRSTRHLVAIKY